MLNNYNDINYNDINYNDTTYRDTTSRDSLSNAYFGNYRLIRLLGRGGFAAVLLGEHQYLKRLAAIKVLRTILDEREKEYFLEEARLLANLVHPHIIRVLEFDVAPRRMPIQGRIVTELVPFLVMEYIPGGNLRTIYPSGTRLSPERVSLYIKQTAEALFYAHTQRIVHRDIKPENLLLNERQGIMLSDFGLALFVPQRGQLNIQAMVGTLPYTAPEQLRGKPEFASDQYSLGVVAYEWLCGHQPFQGGEAEIIMQHVSAPPPRLRSINPALPQAVENVIVKVLAKEPQQRYATVLEFAEALEQAVRQPESQFAVEAQPIEASLQAANVVPFFYYFAQKNAVAPAEKMGRIASYPPLVEAKGKESKDQRAAVLTPFKQRNRQRMLQKVRAYWIDGVLKPSLHEGLFIPPELHEKPDAVADSSWNVSFYQPEKQFSTLAPDLSITEVYDQSGGGLLILGEPGSGKTTLLLQLARHLLDRAEQDESALIPVIFPLSSWAEKQLPIEQWLIEELSNKYQVPRLLGGMWLRSKLLLPLLDGLDEVAESARSACIIAINTYQKRDGSSPLVVCSRLTDYLLFPPRVLLQRAIVVQSLTMQQVNDYFLKAGKRFKPIVEILQRDTLLYGLITTPLMLNIITLAYQERSPDDLFIRRSSKEFYQKILHTYVEQMVQRYSTSRSDRAQQLTSGLAVLAKKMQQNGQVVFYIEQMQPRWIDKEKWRWVYVWLAALLPGALIGGLTGLLANVLLFHAGSIGSVYIDTVYGIVMGYLLSNERIASVFPARRPLTHDHANKFVHVHKTPFITALVVGLITFLFMQVDKGWAAGLANGIFLGVLSFPIHKFLQNSSHARARVPNTDGRSTPSLGSFFPLDHLKNGLLAGVACGLTSVITLLVNHQVPAGGFVFLLTLGIRDSLRNILLGTLLGLLLMKHDGIIYCAEIVSWSWKNFWKSLFNRTIIYNILIGMVVGILFGSKQFFQGNIRDTLRVGLSTGILITLGIQVISAILHGVASNRLNDYRRTVPNEGIRRSLSHGIVSFIVGALITTFFTIVTTLLSLVLSSGPALLVNTGKLQGILHTSLLIALLLAPAGGLLTALLLGWMAVWQHGVLRLILWVTKILPLPLTRFLDYAANCLLLRKTGGGYIFIHRTLLEYFASLGDPQTSPRKDATTSSEPLVRLPN